MTYANKIIFSFFALVAIVLTMLSGCVSVPQLVYPKNYIEIDWATFSPCKREIVFSASNKKYGGIFLMNFQGKVTRWLFKNVGKIGYFQPIYSHDGAKLAYIADLQSKLSGVYISNTDGTNPEKVAGTIDFDLYPAFSPDGERIYFVRNEYYMGNSYSGPRWRSKSDLYYADLIKGTTHRVTHDEYIDMDRPQPLPNGREVLLHLRYYPQEYSLWIVNLTNPALRRPLRPSAARYAASEVKDPKHYAMTSYDNLYNPVLSRDGKYLTYTQFIPYWCDMNTMVARPIILSKGGAMPFDISSDNKKILFKSGYDFSRKNNDQTSNLWMINSDGTGLRNIHLDFSAVEGQASPVDNKTGGKP